MLLTVMAVVLLVSALGVSALAFPDAILIRANEISQQEQVSDASSISMPIEYVNYTVFAVDEGLWATVDGTFPMHIPAEWVGQELPMLYPTPPGVTNISVELNGHEVGWGNFTQVYPDALHYTYLGEWSMINCTIQPTSADFLLTIHYQHPIFQVNGSYVFLYDLNISPYLSASSTSSVAYFSVRFETNASGINVYTVPGDSSVPRDSTRTPVNFAANLANGTETVAFNITSDYSKPVPGDELITFQDSQVQAPQFPLWIILPLLTIVGIVTILLVYFKKRKH